MKKILLGFLAFAIISCDSGKKSDEQALRDSLETLQVEEPNISHEVLADIIQQIPSPLEISVLLKQEGTDYNNSLLNSPENDSKYNSTFQKAVNLGIYGTDLGYANIYEKNQDALSYLGSIKGLADDLGIGQFFNFQLIKELATNSSNLDSLLLITTRNFNDINQHLQNQERSDVSVLLLTGGWLEALHITNQIAKNSNDAELNERIGEQKIILENIMVLLELYKDNNKIADFYKEMEPLQKAFGEIEITYTYEDSSVEEVNGVLVINDNSSSTINITDENLAQIMQVTESIRNKVIL